MNPQLPPNWLNAHLDDELSPNQRAAADARLSQTPRDQDELTALRELDSSLRKLLIAPEFSESQFLAELELRRSESRLPADSILEAARSVPVARRHRSGPASQIFAVTAAMIVLAAIGLIAFVQQWTASVTPSANAADIARVVRFTGHVETQRPAEKIWQQLDVKSRLAVVAGTKIRTLAESLCEVKTTASGTLRLNENTELIIRRAAEIELVTGEFWCMTSGDENLTVVVPDEQGPEKSGLAGNVTPSFACPSNVPTQWSVSGTEIRCLSLADSVAELTSHSQTSCSVEPGQWISVGKTERPANSGYADRLFASAWQLPLLSAGRPDDPELQSLLQSMLAELGHAKVSSMYESRIRGLGPAGTIPLLAFVRSPNSLDIPEERHKAMQIISDLAPESARSDLVVLSVDIDPVVSRLAMAALTRLADLSKG